MPLHYVHIVAVTAFLSLLAGLFAAFEVEAEGKYGWGEKFPTWYRTSGPVAKLYKLTTNKPLTGYHAALFFVPILVFLWPMIYLGHLTAAGFVGAFALYFAWVTVWDYGWFCLNPSYRPSGFQRRNVWWFSREPWVIDRFPVGYLYGWIVALVLAALSGWLDGGLFNRLGAQAFQLGCYLVYVALLITVLGPLYRRYHAYMRRDGNSHDERHLAGIFHKMKVVVTGNTNAGDA